MRCHLISYDRKPLICQPILPNKIIMTNNTDGGNITLLRDGPLFFIRGVTIFGTCRQFFVKSNAFQTIIFITFCNEHKFITTIFKNRYRLFYRSYLKKTLLVNAYT